MPERRPTRREVKLSGELFTDFPEVGGEMQGDRWIDKSLRKISDSYVDRNSPNGAYQLD